MHGRKDVHLSVRSSRQATGYSQAAEHCCRLCSPRALYLSRWHAGWMARCSVQGPWQTCSAKRCASCAQYSATAMDTQHISELHTMGSGSWCTTDAQQTLCLTGQTQVSQLRCQTCLGQQFPAGLRRLDLHSWQPRPWAQGCPDHLRLGCTQHGPPFPLKFGPLKRSPKLNQVLLMV